MPETDPQRDILKEKDLGDTSLAEVSAFVGPDATVEYHPGVIPATFDGLETLTFAFSHVDVDIYRSVRDCCEFIYPRTMRGGIILFDDYGIAACPGARQAVDEFFRDKPEYPLVLHTGQAIVIRRP